MATDVRTAVAQRDEEQAEKTARLARYVKDNIGPQLARVLPRHIPEDRMVRIAVSACRSNPDLLDATPLSLAGALLTAATLGLEPNTPTQECYIVPYKNHGVQEAQLVVGYQGYVKLFRQHPLAGPLWAEAVYPSDDFHYAKGTTPYIHHVPHPEDRKPGEVPTHYYACAEPKGATRPDFVVLTAAEVQELRNGKVGPKGDIPDPQRWMERKTPIRQLVKLLPKTTALALAAEVDEQSGGALYEQAQRVRAERADLPGPPAVEAQVPVEEPPAGGEGL